MYDADSNIVHQRMAFADVGDSGSIALDHIKLITFETRYGWHGWHGLINVKLEGVNHFGDYSETILFQCVDCLPSSSSTDLGRLYLDPDMNGPQDLPGAANCQNSCTFKRGKIN